GQNPDDAWPIVRRPMGLSITARWLSYVVVFPLQNPYIYPVTFANTSELSALVIRMFNEKGTLRDLICKVKPKEAFMRKYCNPKKIQGLELQQIRTYGRQILEVLKFLHDKGFPYGHLHASNIVIEDNTCKVLDIENSLLGLPSYYRPYIAQFRKINVSTGRREQPAGPALVLPALHRRTACWACPRTTGPTSRSSGRSTRLTRAQSHHGSEEEKRRRKILARKVENRPFLFYFTMTAYPGKNPSTNPAGPIVRRPMGLPFTAGCDTARDRTRVSSDASSTEMQSL
uniref:Protein kinase domain-containing protein n=1 Tax=Hucho hucho TaxID=62062 RepID=A0A4W5PN94_9TELE